MQNDKFEKFAKSRKINWWFFFADLEKFCQTSLHIKLLPFDRKFLVSNLNTSGHNKGLDNTSYPLSITHALSSGRGWIIINIIIIIN